MGVLVACQVLIVLIYGIPYIVVEFFLDGGEETARVFFNNENPQNFTPPTLSVGTVTVAATGELLSLAGWWWCRRCLLNMLLN